MAERPIAYEAYEALADHYAAQIDSKPHNAFYDRPAMLSLLPDSNGLRVLDAGCGPGAYAEALLERGATVVACDCSERMLELASSRLENWPKRQQWSLQRVDLTQPLSLWSEADFDGVLAPLCLDYIENWKPLFQEFHRILRPGGWFQFSCGHPSFDAEYYATTQYFQVEFAECMWTGFGKSVMMPGYRRSFEEVFTPLIESGFRLSAVHEPQPTEAFRQADPERYERLMHRPAFLCVQAIKPNEPDAS